jgi:hypothetical protein
MLAEIRDRPGAAPGAKRQGAGPGKPERAAHQGRLGHSVAVLLKVYANCIDGGDDGHNKRIGAALG